MGADVECDDAIFGWDKAALCLSADNAARTAWGQAALLTIAECATRMFRGGVYLGSDFNEQVIVGTHPRLPLRRLLVKTGCRPENPPSHAVHLYVGHEPTSSRAQVRCWADGWTAVMSPACAPEPPVSGNEISGALAGAMATSDLFRIAMLGDLMAGKRTQKLSALTPGTIASQDLHLEALPAQCWMVGLGNLGQGTLWILGLLPYADPQEVRLLLQDTDVSGPENLDTQILTQFSWIGLNKARGAALWRLLGKVLESRVWQWRPPRSKWPNLVARLRHQNSVTWWT